MEIANQNPRSTLLAAGRNPNPISNLKFQI